MLRRRHNSDGNWSQTASKAFLSSVFICGCLWFFPLSGFAQESEQEVVANLAAGRAVLYVARDSIVIGALEQRIEAESRPPMLVPLGGPRIGILLGAVEWVLIASGRPPVRLDHELPRLVSEAVAPAAKPDPSQASDIESIGVALLERLRGVTSQLHRKLDLKPDEPVLELILANYVEGYGAEVWSLRYHLAQDLLRGDYWRTRVMRPSYTQLYPPEKGKPRTLDRKSVV